MRHKLRFFLVLIGIIMLIGPFLVPFSTSGTLNKQQALATVPGLHPNFMNSLNHQIHYERSGLESSENLIILLHGFGASSFSFQKVQESLSDNALVIAYDRTAFGFTDRPLSWVGINPYSFEGQLQVLDDVIEKFAANKNVTLVGHSAGGALALEYTIQNPGRIDNLILIAPALSGNGPYPAWLQPVFSIPQINHLGPILVSRIATEGLSILEQSYFDPKLITEATVNGYTAPLKVQNWEQAFWEFVKAPRYQTSSIQSLKSRTLILTGDSDVIVPTSSSIKNAGLSSFTQLVILKNTGHLPHEEKPTKFVSAVNEFLKGTN
jgi:pimeloyl-ACP methyl ester carboxylesterase